MIQWRSVVFSISLLVLFAEAQWRHQAPPWKCYDCKRIAPTTVEDDIVGNDCVDWNVTIAETIAVPYDLVDAPVTKDSAYRGVEDACGKIRGATEEEKFCLKRAISTAKYFYGRCEAHAADLRIPCRKAGDSMSWYRGRQSVTVFGNKCLHWSDVQSDFDENFHFNTVFSPSLFAQFRSGGVHVHENYCRNPTKSRHGAWCYVRDKRTDKHTPEICFKECLNSAADERLCLGKQLFSYSKNSRYLTDFTINRDTLDVEDFVTNVYGADSDGYDLSDILHLRQSYFSSAGSAPRHVPLYSLQSVRNKRGTVSSRTQCFQTGRQVDLAGPWTFVPNNVNNSASAEKIKMNAMRFDNLPNPSLHGERTSNLFRPCFYACEDINVQCFPDREFPYFGLKDETRDGQKCLTYHSAARIVSSLISSSKASSSSKIVNGSSKEYIYDALFTQIFINVQTKRETARMFNNFAFADAANFLSNKCLNLHTIIKFPEEPVNEVFQKLLSGGPGCFVKAGASVEFAPCFQKCDCKGVVTEPQYRKDVSEMERRAIAAEIHVTKTNLTTPKGDFGEFIDKVNPFSIALVASVGIFSVFG